MKKMLIVSIFFLLINQLAFPQWTNQNPVPDGNDLWSTFFIDDTGWIVGSDGFIKKTTNAGLDWVLQESNTTLILKSVQFINQNTGWICGESGLILKTTDGGENWDSLTSGTTQHLSDLHFYDADTGYVVGLNGTILKTTNGGSVWTNLSSGTTNDLSSLDFVDAFIGYAVGGIEPSYSILKTTDGGLNWLEKPHPLLANLRSLNTVEFVDANTGWIGGDEGACCRGSICKTTDGGESWTCQDLSSLRKTESIHNENLTTEIGGIRSIFFKDTNNGYAVGGYFGDYGDNREIFRTTDGGLTWIEKIYESWHSGLLSVYVNSIGKGWAVGYAGVTFITEDDGNSWAQTLSGKGSVACASADIYSLFFINENIGWAGGYRGWCAPDPGNIILKTTNGGKIWRRQYFDLQAGPTILSLYFINEYIGWAIAEENGFACTSGLYRTTDGGDNWICSEGILGSSIFFINQDTGWVASQNGIHKSSDSGETWIQKSSISSSSVYFLDNNNGWATGWSGILKSTDGGETWVSKAAEDMNYVKFFNSNVGMCVGNTGIVLLSTDGGENWISKSSGTTNDLKSIELTNPTTAWVVGSNGTILHTTDLGDNWTTYDGVSANDLTSISFANENTGWVAGLYGAMFKYAVEPPSPPVWSNQIIVEDSSGTEDSQILTFGQHTDATDSIDSSLGEYELPPVPPTEIFDSRFNLPTSFPISSLTDFRDSSETEITWTMRFQPGSAGYPMTFVWDSTAFPEGSFHLKDLIDGSFVFVNMKESSVYTINNILISTLNIIYYEDGTVPIAPPSPTNLSGIADTSSVVLGWIDNSSNEFGFIIERKEGDSLSVSSFTIIDTVAADDTSYLDIGLIPDTTYTYRLFAFNEFGSSDYSNVFQISTLPSQVTFQLTVSVLDGWNMVSIPGLHPVNQEVTTWWSGMDPSTNVFEYNVSYQVVTIASPGNGYWMKNLGEQTYSTGDEWPVSGISTVDHSPIGCVEGWNMIGGYEYNTAVSSITTTPPGLQESPFYAFSGAYQTSDFLIPGYGYWVKLSADGLINLPQVINKGDELKEWFHEDWGKIILTDASGINYTLYAVTGDVDLNKYELPPMPPAGMFDIRYGSGRIAEDINNSIQEIQMTGVTYPLTVRAEGMDIRLMDESGKTVNVNLKSGEDVVISDATIQKLKVSGELIPAEYALYQNYPNPFNPNTTIKFAIAQDSNVKLIIYDILGEEVLRLIDKEMKAGYHQIELNASQFSSGVYLYTITAGDFVETKKMVLIK